jgi:hypothetical protein
VSEYERKLEAYRRWVTTYASVLSPQARVSLFSQLMSASEYDGVNAKEVVDNFHFKHHAHDSFGLMRMTLHRHLVFQTSKDGIVRPIIEVSNEERSYINSKKNAVLYQLLKSAIDEIISSSIDSETKSVQKQNRSWARKWRLLKKVSGIRQSIKSPIGKKKLTVNWLYGAIFLLISAVVAYVVYRGWAQKPTVNIEFNVGEIIGGILAGAGVLLAGGAYAVKTLRESSAREQG